jgi:hypothetical protein
MPPSSLFDGLLARAEECAKLPPPPPPPDPVRTGRAAFQRMLIDDRVSVHCHFSLLHKGGNSTIKRGARQRSRAPSAKRVKVDPPVSAKFLPVRTDAPVADALLSAAAGKILSGPGKPFLDPDDFVAPNDVDEIVEDEGFFDRQVINVDEMDVAGRATDGSGSRSPVTDDSFRGEQDGSNEVDDDDEGDDLNGEDEAEGGDTLPEPELVSPSRLPEAGLRVIQLSFPMKSEAQKSTLPVRSSSGETLPSGPPSPQVMLRDSPPSPAVVVAPPLPEISPQREWVDDTVSASEEPFKLSAIDAHRAAMAAKAAGSAANRLFPTFAAAPEASQVAPQVSLPSKSSTPASLTSPPSSPAPSIGPVRDLAAKCPEAVLTPIADPSVEDQQPAKLVGQPHPLPIHIIYTGEASNAFVCLVCAHLSPSIPDAFSHAHSSHNIPSFKVRALVKGFQCPATTCSQVFSTKVLLEAHIAHAHPRISRSERERPMVQCDFCGMNVTQKVLVAHVASHVYDGYCDDLNRIRKQEGKNPFHLTDRAQRRIDGRRQCPPPVIGHDSAQAVTPSVVGASAPYSASALAGDSFGVASFSHAKPGTAGVTAPGPVILASGEKRKARESKRPGKTMISPEVVLFGVDKDIPTSAVPGPRFAPISPPVLGQKRTVSPSVVSPLRKSSNGIATTSKDNVGDVAGPSASGTDSGSERRLLLADASGARVAQQPSTKCVNQ